MKRFALSVALPLLFVLLALAAIVHVTGPGWSMWGGETDSGPQVPRAPAPPAGSLSIPVEGVARAALADGWRVSPSSRHGHHAIDIPAPAGTPVLAVADGRIEKLSEGERGGAAIYERSRDGGTIYFYAHLDHYAPALAEGQAVSAGQVIAAVGTTGDAEAGAPHLHFEVHRMAPGEAWWQGREVNPYPLLKGAG